jgi:hypothetical protein
MSNQKEKMLALLQQLETEGDAKNSFLEMLKSGVIVLAGAGLGAAIGKPSLLVGLGTTFAGHYFNQPRLASLGVGMIASGGYKLTAGLKGADVGGLEGAKERFKTFSVNLKDNLYIDKFIKPTASKSLEEGTNGLGEAQYFKYPNNEANMAGLDAIEDEINRSAEQYSQSRQMSGYEDMAGADERIL